MIRSAELRRKVTDLEDALRLAERDRALVLARFRDLEAMEALENQSRRFAESIVRSVGEPLLVLDEGLRVRTANLSYCETFQVSAADTEGRLLYELGEGQWSIPPLRALLEHIFPENTQFQNFEVEHDFPTVGRRTLVLNARRIRWDGGVTPFILLAIEDITERRQAELQLRRLLAANEQMALASLRQREFADAIVSSMAEGVIVYDRQGRVISTNEAARKMLGLSLHSSPSGTAVVPEYLPVALALQGDQVLGHELDIRRPEGDTIWVSMSAAPIYSPDGAPWGAVAAFTDITALHQLQEQRDDILKAVSHDLRNPLTVVLGQAQVMIRLLQKAESGSRLVQSAESIIASARRMETMIQDLTDALRLESSQLRLRKQPTDLKSLTSRLLTRTEDVLEVARVRLEIPDELPLVEADSERLERILINLVSNALKYSPAESKVLIEAEALSGEVRISVSDRGRGIAPEDLPHIFEQFYRTSGERKGGGLGLGLSITKQLVEAHGGRIEVKSQLDEGTTFAFTLRVAG